MSDKGGAKKKKGKPPAARKRKASVPVEDDTGINWKELYESGDLTKIKNAELKTKLKSLGESGAGTKPVMVERLKTALEAVYGSGSPSKKAKAEEDDDDDHDDNHDDDEEDDDDE